MKVFTKGIMLNDVVSICSHGSGLTVENCEIGGFFTDSREAFENGVFLAIKGEHSDGADYIRSALDHGAVCAISSRIPGGCEGSVILVEDTVKALGTLAAWHRRRMKDITVATVTGSVGKTTTKEMIYSVLSEKFDTHKTKGNYNSDIGLPMSLLTLEKQYNAAVYEMGMSRAGEISNLSKIVRPDIAVITNIGTMHIEYLGSREAIRDAKCEITEGMGKNGILVLNGDEPLLAGREGAVYVSLVNRDSDIRALNICEGDNGTSFDLLIHGESVQSIVIPTFGKHNVLNAAMAYTVGKYFGMSDYEIRRGLMNFKGEDMRQRIYTHKDITLIEDCYNAGPESMRASLGVLENYCNRHALRPVAVLGEMRELGDHADMLHKQVGELAATSAKKLFTVGNSLIAEGAAHGGMDENNIVELGDMPFDRAAVVIASMIKPGDCLLFKASRAMKLEKLIDEIKKVY